VEVGGVVEVRGVEEALGTGVALLAVAEAAVGAVVAAEPEALS
jgi:hypothetical protein